MALLGMCYGESPRARLLLSAKSSNYITQGNYQPLRAQSVRYDKVKHLILFLLTSVCVAFNLDTCFGTDRSIRPLQYNKTKGTSALTTNTIHYLNQDWPSSTNRRPHNSLRILTLGTHLCTRWYTERRWGWVGRLYSLERRYLQTVSYAKVPLKDEVLIGLGEH